MSDETSAALVQKVLDGEATAAEVAELEALASDRPEVRTEIEATRALFRALEESGSSTAPPALLDDVMVRIRAARAAATPGRVLDATPRLRRRQWFVAAAAAAAVVAAVVLYPLLRPAADPHAAHSGAMIQTVAWNELDRATASSGASALLREHDGRVEVHVRLAGRGAVEVTWDETALALADGGAASRLRIVCAGGCPPVVLRRTGPGPVGVTVSLPGGEQLELAGRERGP